MAVQILIGVAAGGVLGLVISLLARRTNPQSTLSSLPLMLMFGLSAGAAAGMVLPMTDLLPSRAPFLGGASPGGGYVHEIVSEVQFDELIGSARCPVLVDFNADWCPPCRALRPHLVRFARERKEGVTVLSVNVDRNRGLSQRHAVRAIPALIVYRDGRIVSRAVGYRDRAGLGKLIDGS